MKFITKAFSILLCMVMIFGATVFQVPETAKVEARDIFDVENELKEQRSKLSTLQRELAAITADIAKLEDKSGETTALMTQYLADIDVLENEIKTNTAIKESYDLKRAEVLTERIVVEEDYEYRVSMYKKLMQFIYENSSDNMFELLFSSESFSDFLAKRQHFNDIMTAANNLLKDIEVSIADLETLDKELAEAQSKYETYVDDLERSKIELNTKVKEFETIAKDLNLDASKLSVEYSEKNAEVQAVKSKISALEKERDKYYSANAIFGSPLQDGWWYVVSSRYGYRKDPFGSGTTGFHAGVDFAANRGTPVIAVADGTVTRASWNGGYGECVIVYHGNGISSLYAHLDNTSSSRPVYEVRVGDVVKRGQVLAYVGTTGSSTGNHLHFGIIDTNTYSSVSGNYVNPALYLPKNVYS